MLHRASLLLVLIAFAWPAAAAVKRAPTIDELIGLTLPAEATISPDGRFVAYSARQTDWAANRYERQIWVADTQTGDLLQLTHEKATNSNPAWSPDGRWLAFISDRDETPQIYLISPSGGEARKLTNTEKGVIDFRWSPDGKRLAFTTPDPDTKEFKQRKGEYSDFLIVRSEFSMAHLWALDVDGGDARRLTQGRFSVSTFSWSPDGRKLAFDANADPTMRAEKTSNIYLYNFDDGSVKKIVDEPGPDRNPMWSPDGKQIAFETAMGKPNFFLHNIYVGVVPAEGGKVTNLTAAFDERVSLIGWAPEGVYFAAAQKTASYLFRVDPASHTIQRVSPQDGAVYSYFSFTPDFKRLAFIEADSIHYPEVYVSPVQTLAPKRLTDYASQLKDFTLATREVISWKNSEGIPIEGVLMKPPDFDPTKKYPLLLVLHGGPGDTTSQPALGVDPLIRYYPKEIWAAKAALVLEPNYRGSAGYGEAFHRLTFRTIGAGDYDDVISGVDSLIAKGWVDKDRVGAMGWSFGGFITAWLATNSDRFRAFSVGAGNPDWVLSDAFTELQEITRQYLGASPWNDPEIYRQSSPITYVKRATTPTMIEHGEFDPLAPIGGSYELYQGLVDKGVPTRFYLYKGFGHSITAPKANRAVMEHNLNWFNHYIWGEPDQEGQR